MKAEMIRPHAAMVSALAVLALVPIGCGKQTEPVAPPPPEVGVTQPQRLDVTYYAEFTGTTRSFESVDVRARVSGTLEQIAFEPSHMVERDQLLFVIEPRPYKASLDAAVAAQKSAEADLARAESDLKRVTQAAKTDAVSASDVDLARAKRDMARASVLAAKANVDTAELEYSYTHVRAPIAGQVGRNLVDVGNVVGKTEPTLLTTVKRLDKVLVYFDVPEKALLTILKARSLKAGSDGLLGDDTEEVEAQIATLADDGFPHVGHIDYVSNTVDAATGTIEVRAVIPNDSALLFPGLFVRVRVPGGVQEDAVLVAEKAIGTDLGGRFVYLVGADNVVSQRYVEMGPIQEGGMVPILDGLDGSETYIVEGLLKARPGMPVSPQPVSSTAPAAAN